MTGNQIYVRLMSMRDKAGKDHFERIKLAQALLQDKDWVESESGGGGDEDKAITRIEENCFADLCGVMGLPQLVEIYNAYPNVEDWITHKCNLREMWSRMKAKERSQSSKNKKPKGSRGTVLSPSAAEFFHMPLYRQEQAYLKVEEKVETQAQKIIRLEEENRWLKDRVKELEQQLKVQGKQRIA